MQFNITGPAPTIQQQGRPLTIYLCGPIKDRTDSECRDWREWVKQHWPGSCLDPMRRDYRNKVWNQADAEKMVHQDLSDIDQSDGLVVFYDRPSVGTSMEIFYAAHLRRKPVFLINSSPQPACYLSPWLLYHVCGVAEGLTLDTLTDIDHAIRRRIA